MATMNDYKETEAYKKLTAKQKKNIDGLFAYRRFLVSIVTTLPHEQAWGVAAMMQHAEVFADAKGEKK